MELGHGLNQHRINCSLKDTVYANQEESTFDMLKKTQKSGFILIILEERQFINYYLPTAIVLWRLSAINLPTLLFGRKFNKNSYLD